MKLQKDIPPYDFMSDLDKGGLVGDLVVYGSHKIREQDDLEDLVGEVILEFIVKAESGKTIPYRSFVFGALKNKIADYFKINDRQNGKLESLTQELINAHVTHEPDERSSIRLPKSYKSVLSTAQREVIELIFDKGKSQIEISQELSISPRAVSDRYNKALAVVYLHLKCIPLFEKLERNFQANLLKEFCKANQLSGAATFERTVSKAHKAKFTVYEKREKTLR